MEGVGSRLAEEKERVVLQLVTLYIHLVLWNGTEHDITTQASALAFLRRLVACL